MHKCSLNIHEIKLVIDSKELLENIGGIEGHIDNPMHLGKVIARKDNGRIIVNSTPENNGPRLHELDLLLLVDIGHFGIHIFGDNVAPIHEKTCDMFALSWVTLGPFLVYIISTHEDNMKLLHGYGTKFV
ncbi:hypothetical protein SUGI_0123390 [Cryptomeria japonica]|nr:hypothetical protein SUGI_0123390 [Cryptomeria japonica]